ncbi:VRR-NUC domain-containing protein [Xenorhabdus bovienii]|uniref:VRR-NUC domain-containing protein n=1 Tax=Xenorhabdus bovienii TaxID=40576 RepID=A0A0B6XF48_XENBV|nr:VRR-NUC domain-containing protein [Xenorhabdus bovienii]CDM92205.1 conserved protein of unknown function [Xenorhabdus bovienii]
MTQQLESGQMCPAITSVNCTMERIEFPKDEEQCYLVEKAAYAIWAPKTGVNKKGVAYSLRQAVMSGLIRIEERKHEWIWPYKAEVTFLMRGELKVPLPKLATSKKKKDKYEGNMPQSESFFPNMSKKDIVNFGITGFRRPDIILVKNEQLRWPGRDGIYFDKSTHTDNLKVLIEVKFPGDTLKKDQERDYKLIATKERFGVFKVKDNRDSDEWKNQSAEARDAELAKISNQLLSFGGITFPLNGGKPPSPPVPAPEPEPEIKPKPSPLPIPAYPGFKRILLDNVPLVSKKPWQPKPVFSVWMALNHGQSVPSLLPSPEERVTDYASQSAEWVKDGVAQAKNAVVRSWELTWDMSVSGFNYLSDNLRAALNTFDIWFQETGKWVFNEIVDPVTKTVSYSIQWISDKTGEVFHLTKEKLIEAWQTVCEYTDITLEMLKQVSWTQIVADMDNGQVVLMLAVGETVMTYVEDNVVAAAILLLCGVIVAVLAAPVEIGVGATVAVTAGVSSLAALVMSTLEEATPENAI